MAENEAKPAPAPVPRASDVLAKLSASTTESSPNDKPAPAAAAGSTPGATPSGSSAPTSSGGTTPPAGQVAAPTDDADGRLARLAKEQRRLEKERDSWKAEQKATTDAAASWQKLQEAKTKGGRLAALEALFGAGEIEGELYTELTERIYAKGDGATGLTKEQAEKLVSDKVAAARKADDDARTKAAADAKAAAEAEAAQVRSDYLAEVNTDWQASKEKFPALAAILEELPDAVTGPAILKFTEDHYREHQRAPSPAEIFGHFEAKLSKRFKPADPVATSTAPAGARALPRGDAPVRPDRTKSVKEAWEETKKNLGIA